MTETDRWARVESLFETLIQVPPASRRAVLDSLDPELAADVVRLLRAHDELSTGTSDFLDRLDPDRARALIDLTATTPPGTKLGRYPVVGPLGRGGMGVVYLARDLRLDRPVAIKLLPSYLTGDLAAVSRLAAEARAASALDHPNIATVHEIAETDDGRPFIVMAYYEGETLRERLGRGPMELGEVLEVGAQLAEGLAAAHRAGIVHRDIKPENLILTRDGIIKILDFGIAKSAAGDLVTGGLMRGTAAYMSPEQSRGDPVDHRTDIWSAGVVLYELLAGVRPFVGDGEALVQTIRHDPAPALPARTGLPPAMGAIIARCLEKKADARFSSARELAGELGTLRGARSNPRFGSRYNRIAAALALVGALLLGGIALVRRHQPRTAADAPPAAGPAIAVLPFDVRGPDVEVWREGMADLLATNLDGVTGLRAIDSRTVLARTQGRNGASSDLTRAIGLARETGARFAVLGSAVSSGASLRISTTVYTVPGGATLSTFQADGPIDSVFSLVDQLSIAILAAVWQGRERPAHGVDLAHITTRSLPALKAYLNGEQRLRRGDWGGAIAAYEQAVAADSTFAFAHYHLALAHSWIGEPTTRAQLWIDAITRAVRHSERLPERERALLKLAAAVHMPTAHDLTVTLRMAQQATAIYPDDPEAWYLLGEVYNHAGDQLLVSWADGEKAFRRAIQLDPGFTVPYVHLVNHDINLAPDSARTARLIQQFRALAPGTPFVQESERGFALAFGDSAARRRVLAELDTVSLSTFNSSTWVMLSHPRYWDALRIALDRRALEPTPLGQAVVAGRFRFALARGDIVAAERHLADPLIFEGVRSAGVYRMKSAGLPISDSLVARVLAMPPPEPAPDTSVVSMRIFFAGALAADEGRLRDHAAAVARLRQRAATNRASGDSANARFADGAATALTGYGALIAGDAARGLSLLRAGQVQTTWLGSVSRNVVNAMVRWWIGEALIATGRASEATRYFASLPWDPFAADRLGPIYEELGDPRSAREAYALVEFAWRNAHPILRARATAARQALTRLGEVD